MNFIEQVKCWKISDELDVETSNYLNATYKLLLERINFYENFTEDYFESHSFDELLNDNHRFYAEFNENYTKSYANPVYAKSHLPSDISDIACGLYHEVVESIKYIFQEEYEAIEILVEKFFVVSENILNSKKLYEAIENQQLKNAQFYFNLDIKNEFVDKNFATNLVNTCDLNDIRYLFRYGIYIDESEIKFAQKMNEFSLDYINALALRMVNGYLKGFVSQNKNKKDRKAGKTFLLIGLEKIARQINVAMKKNGFYSVIGEIVYTNYNAQAVVDYAKVKEIAVREDYYEIMADCYRNALNTYEKSLKNYQGRITMVSFGQKKREIQDYKTFLEPKYDAKKKFTMACKIELERFAPKSETSYTGMAFPVYDINHENYDKIFDDIMKINEMSPDSHEKMQDLLIEVLDKSDYVRLVGFKGNETNIQVALHEIRNPRYETNFVNCGADVNIPVGEVFTSPKLTGTNGLIHLQRIRIARIQFKDVKIKVENGFAVEYSCNNTGNVEEDHKLMEDVVFHHLNRIPLGEFALGTNTYAYSLAKKDGVLHLLHTLIYEKLGPHIAIGDTCFSWAEDSPLYSRNGKLIIAKDNEFSIQRKENPEKAYVNMHYDLTIPYDEIGLIQAHQKDGTLVDIVKNGKIVLEGLEELNRYLD